MAGGFSIHCSWFWRGRAHGCAASGRRRAARFKVVVDVKRIEPLVLPEDFPVRWPGLELACAPPDNQVVEGAARFTVLSPTLVRMEYTLEGSFQDRPSYFAIHRASPSQTFRRWTESGFLRLDTGRLRLSYRLGSGPFQSENLRIEVVSPSGASLAGWRPGDAELGNLGGTLRTLDRCSGPLDLGLGLLSTGGWHLQDDSSTPLFTGLADPWVASRQHPGNPDWYFFGYGRDYQAALKDLLLVGGRIPLPPRFAFGSWYSRYWPYQSGDFLRIADQYREHGFPLDVMVLDMDWHLDGWTGYTWNRELIPDPEGLMGELHRRGLKVCMNLHPHNGVRPHEQAYPDFAKAMGLPQGSTLPVPFDIADSKFARGYFTCC